MIDKRTVNTINRMDKVVTEKHILFCNEKSKLANLTSKYLGNCKEERVKELFKLMPYSHTVRGIEIGYICDIRDKLWNFLQDHEPLLTAQESLIPDDEPLPDAVKAEIQAQVKVYSDAEYIWRRETEKFNNYVRKYMKRHNVSESIEKLDELIGVMPGCFFRYLLFEQKVELEKDRKEE